jgi:hypothetical protein
VTIVALFAILAAAALVRVLRGRCSGRPYEDATIQMTVAGLVASRRTAVPPIVSDVPALTTINGATSRSLRAAE